MSKRDVAVSLDAPLCRRAITVEGLVQGVGFRPFVHEVASRMGLRGFVRNAPVGVLIEVEGEPEAVGRFLLTLERRPPPLARIARVRSVAIAPRGDTGFSIEPTARDGRDAVVVSPDVATCEACLRELFDPRARRYRYPFVNCTHCGPRLTIVTDAPWDRERTTMAGFAMCEACRAEYEDPRDRRFHAEAIACPACGPRLRAVRADGRPVDDPDALAHAVRVIEAGGIVAVKGLGGFHLACDAARAEVVAALRRRKVRDAKPFAVMAADLAGAERLGSLSPAEREALGSPARPIVLLERRPGAPVADTVAPGSALLGVMLPYTPLHHLLLADLGGRPLVMTSGNRAEEPIACTDEEAREGLAGIADVRLTHDRPIAMRGEDSVVRVVGARAGTVRRSRGFAPAPLALPGRLACPTLAVGGHLKATFALGEDARAVLSPHLGDLDGYAAYRAYAGAVEHLERLLRVRPRRIVHDLHPDYASTRYARERASADGLELVAVQHHHAHMASALAEHGVTGPAIGVCFDGAGLGLDGAVWGGEFLVGDARAVRRAAHLRYVPMPGGERAIREPWRMALAHLRQAGLDAATTPLGARLSPGARRTIARMLERGVNAPPTSSVGRLFDAVAALAGVCDRASFEGQAAVRLEALASTRPPDGGYPFEVAGDGAIDAAPLVRAVVRDVAAGTAPAVVARRFHTAVVELVVEVCRRLRAEAGPTAVVLTGGVFVNAILAEESAGRLTADGFRVHAHRRVPPNDGGLSLGQLAIAAARDAGSRG